MAKRIAKVISILLLFTLLATSIVFAQSNDCNNYGFGFQEPKDVSTRGEKVRNFINAVKAGDTTAFRLVTYDIVGGKTLRINENFDFSNSKFTRIGTLNGDINYTEIDPTRGLDIVATEIGFYYNSTANVIDTVRTLAKTFYSEFANRENIFVKYLCDGDTSDKSETRKKVIRATLQGLYNLDPRVRLVAIDWLRRLRPDPAMFREVERAVEYETVASSYEKYRPKNIDIPSIDEPGAPGVNVPFVYDTTDSGGKVTSSHTYYSYLLTEGAEPFPYDEQDINYPFEEYDKENNEMVMPDEKKRIILEDGRELSPTDSIFSEEVDDVTTRVISYKNRPTATQLDARKWGNGNPYDDLERRKEIERYIDVMTAAGALRRFRNTVDGYLLGYQYRLGTYFNQDYSGMNPAELTDQQKKEIELSMVPMGHGDKYYYRNTRGRTVLGNSWAELVKLREFIVRAIWYNKIHEGELNSLVIISKDSFKTLYLSIDGETASQVPFLSTSPRQTLSGGGALNSEYEKLDRLRDTDEHYERTNLNYSPDYSSPNVTDGSSFDISMSRSDTVSPYVKPGNPWLDKRHVPVLIQGLLKNPVYSTKWVIARALKDIYLQVKNSPATTEESRKENEQIMKRINWSLKQAKYDALAKDVISGAILHEELITVGKINLSQPNYQVVDLDSKERYPNTSTSGTYAGGVYIPRKNFIEVDEGPRDVTRTGFAIPNDEIIAKRNAKLTVRDDALAKTVAANEEFDVYNYDWWMNRVNLNYDEIDLVDRVLDSFTFYTYGVIDNDTDYVDGEGEVVPAYQLPIRVKEIGGNSGTEYTSPALTYYVDRDAYLEAKSVYYRWNWDVREDRDDTYSRPTPGTPDYEAQLAYQKVVPHFNVEHYNRVIGFINAVVNGDNQFMSTVDWEVVESAELLTLFRMYMMIEGERTDANMPHFELARRVLFNKETRITFFDALQRSYRANIVEYREIDETRPTDEGTIPESVNLKVGEVDINGLRVSFDQQFRHHTLIDIAERFELVDDGGTMKAVKDYSDQRRNAFITSAAAGLFNKDPRVRLTAIHWLRRLGPDASWEADVWHQVRKARGILKQEEYAKIGDFKEEFNDPYREDRPDTTIDRAEFLDVNLYHRDETPNLNVPHVQELFDGSYKVNGELGGSETDDTNARLNYQVEATLYVYSKDFESFVYKRLGLSELAETISLYDMKPGYSALNPEVDPELYMDWDDRVMMDKEVPGYFYSYDKTVADTEVQALYPNNINDDKEGNNYGDFNPESLTTNDVDGDGEIEMANNEFLSNGTDVRLHPAVVDLMGNREGGLENREKDILNVIGVVNPLYTEDRYEYYYESYGLYQFKSASEELEKLYRMIKREILVKRIKSGKEADIFVTMSRFDFSILATKIDDEFQIRIPMASLFGGFNITGANLNQFYQLYRYQDGCINPLNGYYDSEDMFYLPKGGIENVCESYNKYPIFREKQIQVIAQGVDNPIFTVQKGTGDFLIRFYNYYINVDEGTKRQIRDAMFYYKEDDIVIEEVTLAFEGEDLNGRSAIKVGTRLGNDLNPGGVHQYKLLPVELRRQVRRTLNREVQHFEQEIKNILGVRRKISPGEEDKLGFNPDDDDDDFVPVVPEQDTDVPGEEKDDETTTTE